MCFIIYTVHTLCGHRQYSNMFLCHVARGAESHQTATYTLAETRFLPDAENQPTLTGTTTTTAAETAGLACPKRYPTRPVDTCCDACKRSKLKQQAFGEDHQVVASASERRNFSQPSSSSAQN